jgi:glycosyltransferase involved in cell wall biosynthesis
MNNENSNPLVSIVIPVYNKEQWITQTLKSVLEQSYSNWECVLVDDGSNDNSVAVIEKFIVENPANWKLLRQPNAGQATARNVAINNSSGEFISFLDGDDIWARNKIEAQVALLCSNPQTVLVLCPFISFVQSPMNRTKFVYFSHSNARKMLARWLDMTGYGGGTESVGMVRRTSLELVGGFNPNVSTSAGLLLTLQLADIGSIAFCKSTLMGYRQYEEQWHRDHVELEKNMSYVTKVRFNPGTKEFRNITRSQNAYFFITSKGRNRAVLNELTRGFFAIGKMFYSLLLRRIISRLHTLVLKKTVQIHPHVLKDFFKQLER